MIRARAETDRAIASLRTLHAGIVQAAGLTLRGAVKAAESSAKGTTTWKDRSGATRAAIRGEVLGSKGKVIAGGVSKFLENGTEAHRIVARRAHVLHFFANGQEFFRRSVQHPGTKATHFMAIARREGELAAAYGADYYVGYAIERAQA